MGNNAYDNAVTDAEMQAKLDREFPDGVPLSAEEVAQQDAWQAELEREQAVQDAVAAAIGRESAAWRARWPSACTACRGWGGREFPATRHDTASFEFCDALPEGVCHRCGSASLRGGELGEGPCAACGWAFDDGEPTLY